ncbi:UNVERIFIED_CONTAM: uncharacterized protein (TIGR00299 family) protein [Brevibacillus sp. OAP136]
MKIAYLDCFSGLSGDMTLAALVDAGANRETIESELRKLSLGDFRMEWHSVMKTGVHALKLNVIDLHLQQQAEQAKVNPFRVLHSHPHEHRRYMEIVALIEAAGLSRRVTQRALAVFEQIGKAEAKIHNIPVDTVHFHEVGALDSIVDIVGVAIALEDLGIEQLYCGPVPTGNGYVRCDHGLYPVPAPATMEILKGIPLRASTIEKELTTPTGAGIAAALVTQFGPLPSMTVESIGYGAGTRNLPDQPNVLRVMIGTL